jgi:hypothetical protein
MRFDDTPIMFAPGNGDSSTKAPFSLNNLVLIHIYNRSDVDTHTVELTYKAAITINKS